MFSTYSAHEALPTESWSNLAWKLVPWTSKCVETER